MHTKMSFKISKQWRRYFEARLNIEGINHTYIRKRDQLYKTGKKIIM